MGVPVHIVNLAESLYEFNSMVVRVDDEEFEAFPAKQGACQGCILSPQLFNIYGEHIICEPLEYWTGGISIRGRRISNLRYADDTTLIALDEEEMVELVKLVKIASKKLELCINASKTKVMVVDRIKCLPVSTVLSEYEMVNSFIYLGSIIELKQMEARRQKYGTRSL